MKDRRVFSNSFLLPASYTFFMKSGTGFHGIVPCVTPLYFGEVMQLFAKRRPKRLIFAGRQQWQQNSRTGVNTLPPRTIR